MILFMESQTLTLIIWIIALVFTNITLILLFGRAIHNLIKAITESLSDGKLTNKEIERISNETSNLVNIGIRFYKSLFTK